MTRKPRSFFPEREAIGQPLSSGKRPHTQRAFKTRRPPYILEGVGSVLITLLEICYIITKDQGAITGATEANEDYGKRQIVN
jgi:hypothetical protein